MLLTDNKTNDNSRTYAKQIHVYNGFVYAEIVYQDKNTDYDYKSRLWFCTLYKKFGSFWNSRDEVKESDLIEANRWADEQLQLLNKYAVNKLSQSQETQDRP